MANPFSTRFVRPGAIPYFFSEKALMENLLLRLKKLGFRAQIVGPHGCGKTTLGLELCRSASQVFPWFRQITVRGKGLRFPEIEEHDVERGSGPISDCMNTLLQSDLEDIEDDNRMLFLVDGWEHISRLNRWMFIQTCQRCNHGLIVTTHRPTSRLPVLKNIQVDRKVFFQLVRYLQRNCFFELDGHLVDQALRDSNDNFREAFMQLYDAYEREMRLRLGDSPIFGEMPG